MDEDDYESPGGATARRIPCPRLSSTDSPTPGQPSSASSSPALDRRGGFADFRGTATTSNSLLDRLRALALPRFDVEDGLERYLESKARTEELEEHIERTGGLIDQIVYRLYGLTDDEIEIVEAAGRGNRPRGRTPRISS